MKTGHFHLLRTRSFFRVCALLLAAEQVVDEEGRPPVQAVPTEDEEVARALEASLMAR